MSQPWTNHINNAYFQYPGISSRAPNLGSHQTVSTVNNIGDVKTRAYVNPSFVKLPYPLPNPNNFTGSKKIHINPNFKRTNLNFFQSTNNAAQLRKESNYIHVNPNFNKFKICDTSNITSQYDHAPPSQKIGINPTQTNSQKGSADLSTNTNQCPPSSKPYPSNHNSTYFWSKYNTKSPQTTEQYESQQEILDNQKNIQIANNLAKLPKIKTRHKIVRTHSSSPINKEMNSKFKVKNKYKVVNIEKRIGNSSKTIKKINLTDLSKTNILSISRRENVKHGVQFIKLKTPSYKSNSIHRLTNLIKTKYKINRLTQRKKDMKLVSDGSTYRKKKFAQITDCYGKGYENRKLITKSVPAVKVCRVWKLGSSKNLFRVNRNSSWKNNVSIKDVKRKGKSYPNRALVNIGGIMYKSTVNKLTLASDKKQTSQTLKQVKPKVNSTVGKIGQVVYVRGEKFLLGDGGKTLIRQTNVSNAQDNCKSSIMRVDIGGVTFIEKGNNVLIQTNTHQARSLVHYAKQRSIAVLKNLHKRSNMPCMIYHRFGVCSRHKKGMCIYIHDPKNIALCKKFLKGQCNNTQCLLSHNVVEEKMATCHFFLKGNCNRENCPYLHVKVNKKAVICRDFLQGFCSLGQNCKKRHVHQCPDFDEKGTCSQGAKCPYPHKSSKSKGKASKCYKISKFRLTKKTKTPEKQKSAENIDGTKLKETSAKKPKSRKRKSKKEGGNTPKKDMDDSVVECIPKRIKLNDLPLFIPLNS